MEVDLDKGDFGKGMLEGGSVPAVSRVSTTSR